MALFGKPQYSTVTVKKKDIPKDLWTKCPKTGEIIYNKVLKENLVLDGAHRAAQRPPWAVRVGFGRLVAPAAGAEPGG